MAKAVAQVWKYCDDVGIIIKIHICHGEEQHEEFDRRCAFVWPRSR